MHVCVVFRDKIFPFNAAVGRSTSIKRSSDALRSIWQSLGLTLALRGGLDQKSEVSPASILFLFFAEMKASRPCDNESLLSPFTI